MRIDYRIKIGFWGAILFLLFTACKEEQKSEHEPTDQVENTSQEVAVSPEYETEMNHLIRNPKIEKAFRFIKEFDEETLANQIGLTELEAPPFKEHEFGRPELFQKLMEAYGIDSLWMDQVGNILGLRKGSKGNKTLVIGGHLDTVFPEGTDVSENRRNDTIYMPGIGDNGRGLTVVLTLLKTLNEAEILTEDDLLFVANVGEEGLGDLRGVKELFSERGPKVDYFIGIEPGNASLAVMNGNVNVLNGGIGSHRYRVTFNGPGGHSWGSFGLANPAHAMAKAISVFVEKADRFTQDGPKTSYNIGRINGGTSVNSVPFSTWFEVDMRSYDPESLEEIDRIFQKAVQEGLDGQNKIRRIGSALTVDIEMIGDRPSGTTDPSEPLVQRGMASLKPFGEVPVLGAASTDANIPISLGIPALTVAGGGEAGGFHSLDEWYLNKEAYKGIQRLLLLVVAQTGMED